MKIKKLGSLLCLTAMIFGLIACKEQVAQIGQPAPEIAASNIEGKHVKLSEWQGDRILTFWSGSCGMCVKELKKLSKLTQTSAKKIQLIGINVDGEDADVQALAKKYQLDFPILKDQMKITAERYQLVGTPTSFLIDAAGNLKAKYEGNIPEEDLKKIFE